MIYYQRYPDDLDEKIAQELLPRVLAAYGREDAVHYFQDYGCDISKIEAMIHMLEAKLSSQEVEDNHAPMIHGTWLSGVSRKSMMFYILLMNDTKWIKRQPEYFAGYQTTLKEMLANAKEKPEANRRFNYTAQAYRYAYMFALECYGVLSTIKEEIANKERSIVKGLAENRGSMKPSASPRIWKDAYIAGLREVAAMLETIIGEEPPLED